VGGLGHFSAVTPTVAEGDTLPTRRYTLLNVPNTEHSLRPASDPLMDFRAVEKGAQ